MIISESKRFVFIHNPKTAGMSFREPLKKYNTFPGRYWGHKYCSLTKRIIDSAHIPMSDFKAREDFRFVSRYFTFGFCRNPYDRYRSAYSYFRKNNPELAGKNINLFTSERLSFEKIFCHWNYVHFVPQTEFFYAGKKRVADYIGRLESFEIAKEEIFALLGFSFELPTLNVSGSSDHELSEETVAFVNHFYREDFRNFNYEMRSPEKDSSVYQSMVMPQSAWERKVNGEAMAKLI